MRPPRVGPRRAIDWAELKARLADAVSTAESSSQVDPERARRIMDARARALARPLESIDARRAPIEVLAFALGAEAYAIETTYVQEVVKMPPITAVPGTAQHLIGVANVRGEILAIMDLRRLLGIAPRPPSERSRVVVLGGAGAEFGILADAVDSVVTLLREEVFELPERRANPCAPRQETGRFVYGSTRSAVTILDGSALLSDPLFFHNGDEPQQ